MIKDSFDCAPFGFAPFNMLRTGRIGRTGIDE
jgi:hypothetical protein